MTSLSKQLEALRTSTVRQLTVERKHVSLLFDRQEAEKLDRETVHKIGCTGFAQLKKLDASFEDCSDFFDETVINFQRTMISKEENEELNKRLEKFIFKLSPYLLHFSCQQVLEWLINRFQIYAYNAELLISAFLPFHDTNLYGRLLSIIEYNFSTSKDWAFLEEFGKKKLPVPFRIVVKSALSSTHSLLTRVSDHIDKGIQVVGADFLETKSPLLFTFYAKLVLAVLDHAKAIDDGLLSKIIPLLGNGLRSPIPSFRNACMMIVCQLCLTVKLAPPVVSSITKILLMKMKETTLASSLSTLVVICQLQSVQEFSRKAILKFLRREATMGLWSAITALASQTDLTAFLIPLWSTLFTIAGDEESSEEEREAAFSGLSNTSRAEMLHKGQAQAFLSQLLAAFAGGISLPTSMNKDIHAICLRFADDWEQIHTEWSSRDNETLERFVKTFELENLIAVSLKELGKKKRRRSGSMRKSISEEQKPSASERAEAMANSSEFARRQVFSGDPLKKALGWILSSDMENLNWALDEMTSRKAYLSNKLPEDVEEFTLQIIKLSLEQKGLPLDKIKSALSQASFREEFAHSLLLRYEVSGSSAKKPKGGKQRLTAEKAFEDEKDDVYWRRVLFVMETLSISPKFPVSSKIFIFLFELLKESDGISDGQMQHSIQHFAISMLTKMLENPGTYKVTAKDLQMDCVVDTMRQTTSHHVLRDALKLLTAAVKLNPGSVTSHIMSVFTFMGSGLLRKDNDLTLGIIERTLEALFSAVVRGQQVSKPEVAQRLIAVARIFAASAPDIPAHRRARMARSISRAVGVEGAWIIASVMIEGFCAKWQRSDPSKKNTDQDAFEDIAQELCSDLNATEQLRVVLDLVQFVVRLGGDSEAPKKPDAVDVAIFDRTKYTVQKLRHFRFILTGITVKILSSRTLLEKLSKCNDEELYGAMLPIGKRLMTASVELDEFGQKESQVAEKSADPQTLRYWVALQARSDTVAEKLRYLLPGGVAAKLISDVLEDDTTETRMREKVLQLANLKLLTEGFFYSDSGINEEHLTRLAGVLNKWITPVRGNEDKVELCKNATFSLKLVAKRIPKQSESVILTETMDKCVALVKQWQTLDESMVGNVLFLAGELIRSHNMRSTMLSCEPLLQVCINILSEFLKTTHQVKTGEDDGKNKRQRVRQQSLSGRKLGSDALLIAGLTCLQRILDQFAAFISVHMGEILIRYSRLSGKFPIIDNSIPAKGTVQHRLALIRLALSNMEFRTLPTHFAFAVKEVAGEEKALCSLMTLLGSYFHQKNRSSIVPIRLNLLKDILLPAFDFRNIERTPANFENVASVEKCAVGALLKMADVLTDVELRSVVNTIVEWAEPALGAGEQPRSQRVRLIPVFHFANEFYGYFNHLAMPYFGKLVEMAPKVLSGCNATNISDSSLLLLNGKKETVEGLETDFLIHQVIIFIGNCGRHKEFLSQDRVDSVSLALIEELVNTRVAGHEARCVPHLAEAIYRVSDASPESFSEMLNNIMLKTRNNRPKIRFRTLLVVESLLDRIGDGIAPHLPMIMPFLSELLEDENKNVEDQCDRVIRMLQKKFGENISEGFA